MDRDQARSAIVDAKDGDGGALVGFGSTTTWIELLAAGLVHELYMLIGAGVLLGRRSAFSSVRPTRCG